MFATEQWELRSKLPLDLSIEENVGKKGTEDFLYQRKAWLVCCSQKSKMQSYI